MDRPQDSLNPVCELIRPIPKLTVWQDWVDLATLILSNSGLIKIVTWLGTSNLSALVQHSMSKICLWWAGALVGDDSWLLHNPALYTGWKWHFLHWVVVKLYCLFEKTENKRKRSRGWPIFKKNCRRGVRNIAILLLWAQSKLVRIAVASDTRRSRFESCH